MHRLVLFLSLLCLVFSATNWPVKTETSQPVAVGAPWTPPVFQVNLQDTATLTISHNKPVQVCLQEFYPIPTDSNWWNQSCTRWYSFPTAAKGETRIVKIRNVPYTLSVALWDQYHVGLPSDERDSIDLNLGRSGDSCPDNTVWDGAPVNVCREPINASINTPISKLYAAQERNYFYFVVPPRAEAIRVVNVLPEGNGTHLTFQIRRMATPSPENYDGTSSESIEFNYPRPGKYFLVARANIAGEGAFNITIETCPGDPFANTTRLGPQCAFSYITNPQPNMNMRAYAGRWTYWLLTVSQQNPVSVMVRSFDGQFLPRIYASRDQLPTISDDRSNSNDPTPDADINNCHASACSGANTINITYSSTGTAELVENWYIGVTAGAGANDTLYGIWFTPICAPGCDTHGECVVAGPYIGECTCDAQWLGPDCSTQSDVNARFIVLCVIAVLLVASAVVGIVVQKVQLWRRSKHSYEQVG